MTVGGGVLITPLVNGGYSGLVRGCTRLNGPR